MINKHLTQLMTMKSAFLGIIMLDTEFTRLSGDVGNPQTFTYPVCYARVTGASTKRIVNPERPDPSLTASFIQAAQKLADEGAVALITSCGFLSTLQAEIAKSVSIPVVTSVLNLVPLLHASLGNRVLGIITANRQALTKPTLDAAAIDLQSVRIVGMDDSLAFNQLIFDTMPADWQPQQIADELLLVAEGLVNRPPKPSAIVLECTNLQPYATTLKQQFNIPVFGIVNVANLLWEASQAQDNK
ncbi:MAG: aspartate/glutamate racemase family protein [Ostreibacterium sp.]